MADPLLAPNAANYGSIRLTASMTDTLRRDYRRDSSVEGLRRTSSAIGSDTFRRRRQSNASVISLAHRKSVDLLGIGGELEEENESFGDEEAVDDEEYLLEGDTAKSGDGTDRSVTSPFITQFMAKVPFGEVNACVPNTDDPDTPVNTLRMWAIAILFTLLGSASNMFFSLRYPSIALSALIAQLLAHPLGKAWAAYMPHTSIPFGIPGTRLCAWVKLNDERDWSAKEAACVFVAGNVSFGWAYATDVIVEQVKFYGQDFGVTYQVLLVLTTQLLGYAFAGLTRRLLITPSSMVWPATLVNTSLFSVLHSQQSTTRYRFFKLTFLIAFFYYFLPGFIFPALSWFGWPTWIWPESRVVNQVFGVRTGLGVGMITWDWAQVAYVGSPLLMPWWAQANVLGSLVAFIWVLAPVLYYSNVWFTAYLPISSPEVFDNGGQPYDVTRVIAPDLTFDKERYEAYSPLYLPATYVITYGLSFAALTALVVHTWLNYRHDIWKQWRAARGQGDGEDDIHSQMMKKYPDVPAWWYVLLFVVCLGGAMYLCEHYPVHLPWYGVLLAVGLGGLLFVPIGIVTAIANQTPSLLLLSQVVCGYLFPGRPVANMVFVCLCYITNHQGITFSSDMKLGHYMKVPPRVMMLVQVVATGVGSLTQIFVMNWMFGNIRGICTLEAENGFTCPFARVHFNGSMVWGLIGPGRFFGRGQMYHPLLYCFLAGALIPILIYYLTKRYPTSLWKYVHPAIILGGTSWIPPATGVNYWTWAIVGFISNRIIRRRAEGWWSKYNFVLSAALDSSLALGVLVVYFAVVYPGMADKWQWWGIEVFEDTCDWKGCAWKTVEAGEKFGRKFWW
ncbi:hypothetical protein YB2330_000205 [Saitoella coloradoensis]